MISYANEVIEVEGCPGCSYANHEFCLPCGMAYENERFTLSQDWELPIPGFMVVSPKRCIQKLEELSHDERNEIFDIVDKTIRVLRENNICDRFNVIFEEKENIHFHVWIMPRYKWIEEKVGRITGKIDEVFEYAKLNMKNDETYEQINKITEIINRAFNK